MSIRTLLTQALLGLCLALLAPATGLTQPAQPAPQVDQNYILGPGDMLEVDMLERTDFNTKAKIGTDGFIQLPYIGSIAASNRTIQQLSDQIKIGRAHV